MSNRGDLKKALKENGYKLVRTGKHFVYADAQGHEVQVHLGDTMRKQQLRGLLGSITKGNVKSGKRVQAPEVAPLVWEKVNPQHYKCLCGPVMIGYVHKLDFWMAYIGTPGVYFQNSETLADAKAAVENRVQGGA